LPSAAGRFAVEAPQTRLYAPRCIWAPMRVTRSRNVTPLPLATSAQLAKIACPGTFEK